MKIGIDVDEVLADHLEACCRYYNKRFDKDIRPENFHVYRFWEVWGGTRDEAVQIMDDFWQSEDIHLIQPCEGAIEAIRELSKNHELHVITSRFTEMERLTREWLDLHFGPVFASVHHTNYYGKEGIKMSKGELANQLGLDVMIEDSLDYAHECLEYVQKAILFARPWNRTGEEHPKIVRVDHWHEVEGHLNES